jgi:hypothetical protein
MFVDPIPAQSFNDFGLLIARPSNTNYQLGLGAPHSTLKHIYSIRFVLVVAASAKQNEP